MRITSSIFTRCLVLVACLATVSLAPAVMGQKATDIKAIDQKPSGSDPQFKVKLDFDRWHDCAEIKSDLLRMEKAWPKFLKYSSVGKSYDGKDMMCMTINNPDTGPELSKAAMYIEANVHGNEIQGAEICLYTVWYLMENYGRIEAITKLVNERVFYLFPTVNPDGRDYFMKGPTGVQARGGHVPTDEDNDGLVDQDDIIDLNGNGVIDQIRKYVPGQGNYRKSALDPRMMEPVPQGEKGDYIVLGREGMDNDGDGFITGRMGGGYDPNRNWASDWQPDYIQGGSMHYPFELPEAKAINDFLLAHPNIAGVQSYHNNGGMILRGPGAEWMGEYSRADVQAYDELGRNAERILPFYRYLVIWSGLYTVHGGFIDWTNDGLGILSFSNELWNNGQYYTSPELKEQQKDPNSPINPRVANYWFNDYLEFGDEFTEWKEFDHPQFGKVEMGGTWKKTYGRVPPRFMNEELCHRNMAFTLYQAGEMPKISLGESSVELISDNVYRVRVDIKNEHLVPTILAKAAENNVVTPDLLTVEGKNVEVLSAGWVLDKFRKIATQLIDQRNLKRIMLRNGQPGDTTRTIEYLVRGSGDITVAYASVKGGTARKTIALK
ncbi:MAG: peptidase M14 [Acidobacteriia bacterium]|nr:peptidase M14 [Terriglobia bacterium]